MSQVNTITYYNALTVNGIDYNIKFMSPDTKVKGDSAKITKLVESILCSQFDKDRVEDLSSKQITETIIEFNPKEGSKIAGNHSDKKIREVFFKTFSENEDYKGMNVADNEPTISDAIEDLYNVQTSESISGSVNPGWVSWATSGLSWAVSGATDLISKAGHIFSSRDLEKSLNTQENLEYIREICNAANKGQEVPSEARKYLSEVIIPHIKGEISKEKENPDNIDNIKSKFLNVIDLANTKLDDKKIAKNSRNFDKNISKIIQSAGS